MDHGLGGPTAASALTTKESSPSKAGQQMVRQEAGTEGLTDMAPWLVELLQVRLHLVVLSTCCLQHWAGNSFIHVSCPGLKVIASLPLVVMALNR